MSLTQTILHTAEKSEGEERKQLGTTELTRVFTLEVQRKHRSRDARKPRSTNKSLTCQVVAPDTKNTQNG